MNEDKFLLYTKIASIDGLNLFGCGGEQRVKKIRLIVEKKTESYLQEPL